MNKQYVVKVVSEKWWQSILSDVSTFALALGLIGVGVWLQSNAMQWLGVIIFFVTTSVKASNLVKKFDTKKAAKDYIDTLEGINDE